MKLISHRGNINGTISSEENKPSYIDCAIQSGYDVEIDVRFINNQFYLGHDNPDYIVNDVWILERRDNLLIHCKDLDSVCEFKRRGWDLKCFCHVADPYVLTSDGYVWIHDLTLNLNDRCIIPLITMDDVRLYNKGIVYAVCTDVVKFAEYELASKGLYKKM